jgi:hypothetical protein
LLIIEVDRFAADRGLTLASNRSEEAEAFGFRIVDSHGGTAAAMDKPDPVKLYQISVRPEAGCRLYLGVGHAEPGQERVPELVGTGSFKYRKSPQWIGELLARHDLVGSHPVPKRMSSHDDRNILAK